MNGAKKFNHPYFRGMCNSRRERIPDKSRCYVHLGGKVQNPDHSRNYYTGGCDIQDYPLSEAIRKMEGSP